MIETVYVLMMTIALGFAAWLAFKRQWFALFCVALSQFPFWAGYGVWFYDTELPVKVNMLTDFTISALFVWLAYRLDHEWLIWLGVVFLCALIVDIFALIFGATYYLELHEIIHYTALVVIAGRGAVVRVDRHIRRALVGIQD